MGGGTLLVPGLTLLFGFTQHAAQGVSLLLFLPTSLTALFTHHKYGHVAWRLAAKLAAGAVIGSYLGAKLAFLLPSPLLRKIFAGYLVVMGAYQFFANPREEAKG